MIQLCYAGLYGTWSITTVQILFVVFTAIQIEILPGIYPKNSIMKRLFVFIATFVSLTAQAQDNNPTQKILIGFNFSPDYNYRTLKNNDGSASGDLVIKKRNDIEVAKFGFTTGLNVYFNFSHLLGLETGIQFSSKGYQTKKQDLIYFPPDPGSPTNAITKYSYQYVGIPLKAKFSFGKQKVHLISSFGLLANYLLNVKQSDHYEYADGRIEKKKHTSASDFKKLDISPMISVGIDYSFNQKIHLLAEPTFRYGVLETKDAPVTENLWSAGLNVGFYYAL